MLRAGLLLTLSACASEAPPLPDALDLSVPAAPSAAISDAPVPPAGKDLLAIRIPDGACRVEALPMRHLRQLPLALSAGKEPFAWFQATGGLTLHIPKSDAAVGLIAEVETDGVVLRGITRADAIDMYLKQPWVFGGLAIPTNRATLEVVAAKAEGIELKLDLPPQIVLESGKTLTSTVPCEIASLGGDHFDAMTGLPGATTVRGTQPDGSPSAVRGVASDRVVLIEARTPLSLTPDGAPVATLVRGALNLGATVLRREKTRAQIAWDVGEVVAFGWVDAKKLRVQNANGPGIEGEPEPPLLGLDPNKSDSDPRGLVCDQETPLRAEVGGQNEVVAIVARGVVIWVGKDRGAALEVTLPFSNYRPTEGARLMVDRKLAERCTSRR